MSSLHEASLPHWHDEGELRHDNSIVHAASQSIETSISGDSLQQGPATINCTTPALIAAAVPSNGHVAFVDYLLSIVRLADNYQVGDTCKPLMWPSFSTAANATIRGNTQYHQQKIYKVGRDLSLGG